ncbi:MAG: metallophosphoesterase [Verrucomicrobia subdivision 3 bacterium]|nr:metallophosphoesterase [Limisphaerales bacterium]
MYPKSLKLLVVCVVAMFLANILRAADGLVPTGADWRYLDNGSDQGTGWRAAGFDDSGWAVGAAQLGYGDGDESTVVSFGPDAANKYITTYFRRSFNVSDASAYQSVTLRLLRDDGGVVYLNGTEVFRSNMPGGTISYNTLAPVAIGGAEETTFFQTSVSPAVLVSGNNVLAVEIHQANGTSSDISFDLELTASTTPPSAVVTRGPYLQMGTPTSIIVRWRTDIATDSRVHYGAAPGNLTSFADDSAILTEHQVTLTGLSPESLYYYAVGSATQTLAGDDADHFFVTFPPPGTPTPTRVWVLGDSGTANASAQAVRNAYFNATGARHTDLWLMLGDNAYNSGTDSEYQNAVFNMYPTMLRKSALFSTRGNHEADANAYYSIFSLPSNGEGGGLPSGTEAYYSFDFGNVHFVCLDAFGSDRSTSGPMAAWLQNDLAATTRDWIVAFWHHPPYSKGSHNSDTEIELVEMRENMVPILEAGGVDLVLCGHSHSYERSFLIDGHYGTSGTFNSSHLVDGGSGRDTTPYLKPAGTMGRSGAVYTVAGSSGQTSGGKLNHPAMFISLNALGSVVLDFETNRLDLSFLDSTGVVRDYFTILKPSPSEPPPTPTGLTASAGDSQVALNWNASIGAVSYIVKRADSSGGPYEIIGSGVTATTFTDDTVVNGSTYYYVVSAVNSNGESGDSDEVSATPQPPTAPLAPTNLTAAQGGKRRIVLHWTQSASPNVTQNGVYRSTTSGGPYTLVATIPAATSYQNAGLTSGTRYYFVVTALDGNGLESSFSNEATAVPR